ncbi:MAG: CRISPR-associated protein Cas4 [Clostridia bacterium]|nr:CRISPR-associated protein Cas4 [Clostridia bacterium]
MNAQEPLLLSGLQHFAFCRRQWALIHIEQQWSENVRTAEGMIFHRRAHDDVQFEARGDLLIARGLRIASQRLNVVGVCDVVEFHRDSAGIELFGREGRWSVYPVEYKKGASKQNDADRLQLCGQAMCLEEMLACEIPEGSLFYGATRRREQVQFTDELRKHVSDMLDEMRQLFERGYTPRAKPTKGCNACSLRDLCLPRLNKLPKVSAYIAGYTGEGTQ